MNITGEMLTEAMRYAQGRVSWYLPWEVDDVLQEACLKALQHEDSFRGDSPFNTWFFKIAINECLMRIRKRSGRTQFFPIVVEPTLMKLNPEQIAIARERTADLAECIMLLSPTRRSEILQWALGVRDNATKTSTRKARRLRARKELKVMLSV